MGAYALEVATRIDRRQCVAQIAGGCLGAEVGMPKASIPHDALAFVGDGTRAVFFRKRGTIQEPDLPQRSIDFPTRITSTGRFYAASIRG
jgi:hypothetical protein